MKQSIENALKQALHFHQSGDLQQAESIYRQLLRINPEQPDILHLLGVIALQYGRHQEAIAMIGRAVELKPGNAQFHNHLGSALFAIGQKDAALAQFEAALRHQPNFPDAAHNLALVLFDLGHLKKSIKTYRNALIKEPHHGMLLNEALKNMADACDWHKFNNYKQTLFDVAQKSLKEKNLCPLTPYQSLCLYEDKALQRNVASAHAKRIQTGVKQASKHLTIGHKRGAKPSGSHAQIRIGYLCADFRDHPTAHLLCHVLESHTENVDIFAYSLGENDNSSYRKRIESACSHFRDMQGKQSHLVASQIFDDKIDILIDVMGYISNAKPEILALRPAPIQVNFLAYPGTMGAAFIDYIVTDAIALPETDLPFFSEKPIYMPHTYFATDPTQKVAEHSTRTHYGLPEKGFVFGCFNKPSKITPEIFDVWCRLLQKTDDSVLWLYAPNTHTQDNLKKEAKKRNIDPHRLYFATRLPKAEHLARYAHIDLFLDCMPVNAHTTAIDALFMATPILTCTGNTIISRASSSIITAAGLADQFIASSLQDYEAKALAYASDPASLTTLKETLSAQIKNSPLFNTNAYVKALEDGLYQAMKKWMDMHHPGTITVNDS